MILLVIKNTQGENSFGHLMYGSILLHFINQKNSRMVREGTTDFFVARVYTTLGWQNSKLSLANTLPTDNTCNNEYYGFINCIDGRKTF